MLLPNAGKEWYNGVEVITLLKVFLVEDECVVREGLRDCIDWERYGFEFCGDAPDGELALPQIRKLRPDILITDIKMPFMDGLALSKLVCAELPETRIILISGHNDFEFAQEAIEIGVEQYLLKPVTKSSLLKTLEDVSRKIDEEREQKAYLRRFQQEGREYEQYARRKFFEQVTSGSLRVSEIYEQAKKLQIDIDAEGYTVILLTLQSRGAAEYSQTLADRLEELMAYLLRYGEYLLFRCNLMTYCIIIKGSGAGLNDAVHRCLENIQRRCGGDEALAWYAAVSDPVARLSELPGCYARAHTILSYRHLLPEQHVLTADVLKKPQRGGLSELDEVDASKADPAIIRSFLQTGMREEIPDFVSEYLSSFGNALNSLLFRQYVLLELRFSAIRAAKSFGYSQEEFLRPLEPAQARAVDADLPELKKSCAAFLRRAIELREEESGNQYKSGAALDRPELHRRKSLPQRRGEGRQYQPQLFFRRFQPGDGADVRRIPDGKADGPREGAAALFRQALERGCLRGRLPRPALLQLPVQKDAGLHAEQLPCGKRRRP